MDLLLISKFILAGVLIIAGILHFVIPNFYLKIMPAYLPAPKLLVFLSGIAEIISGLLLLFPQTQNWGAFFTIALLIAVFPANIEMSRKYFVKKKKGFWWTILRLPFQIVLIWWAFKYVK